MYSTEYHVKEGESIPSLVRTYNQVRPKKEFSLKIDANSMYN